MKFSKSGPSQKPILKRFGLKAMIYFLPLSNFLKLYSHFRLYIFLDWLIVQSRKPKSLFSYTMESSWYWGQVLSVLRVVSTALVTIIRKRHSIRILHHPPPPLPHSCTCNDDITLSSNTIFVFYHFPTLKGEMRVLTLILKVLRLWFHVFAHFPTQFVHGCRYTVEVVNIYCFYPWHFVLLVKRVLFLRS